MRAATPFSAKSARKLSSSLPDRRGALTSLVFDLDGTLIDSAPGIAASLAVAFQSVGRSLVEPSVEIIRKAIGPPMRVIARGIEPTLTEEELGRIESVYRSEYDTHGWRNSLLFEGVGQVVGLLRSDGMRLFLVTNKPRLPTDRVLRHFELHSSFEGIVTRDGRSPAFTSKSEMLAALVQRYSIVPADTLMVGDTAEDQEAAQANHLEFLHVKYGYGSTASPSSSIERFYDLPIFLKQQFLPECNSEGKSHHDEI